MASSISNSKADSFPRKKKMSMVQYPWPSTINVANFISMKLYFDKKNTNYEAWKEQLLCLIEGQDLLGFIDGSILTPPQFLPPPPPETGSTAVRNQDYLLWRRTERLLKGWILGSLNKNMVSEVAALETSRDVCLHLEKKFCNFSNQRRQLEPENAASTTDTEVAEGKWHDYLPLCRAILSGDWNKAKETLEQDPNTINVPIAFTLETALHIAVGSGKKAIHIVKNLVDLMPDDSIGLKSKIGYTALHTAAQVGNTQAAKMLVSRRPDLLYMKNNDGDHPVHLAAWENHRGTLCYLISQIKDDDTKEIDHTTLSSPYVGKSGVWLLNFLIDAHYFDVALYLAEKFPDLAALKFGKNIGNSVLQRIAEKDSAFASGTRYNFWERFIYSRVQVEKASKTEYSVSNVGDIENPAHKTSVNIESKKWHKWVQSFHAILCKVIEQLVPRVEAIRREKQIHQQALCFVKSWCKNMESLDYKKASRIYTGPIISAASLGVHEVVEEIVATFPLSIYCFTFKKRYIFHVAVENRCEKVFNLIYQASDHKHQYADLKDSLGNNLLHLAAKLGPPHKLNLVSGAALQMQRELQWFKEVEKFVNPFGREDINDDGKTPTMIFTEEHISLKAEGEKWMKDTANSCTIAAALIATIVFAAAITVPGGNEADSGFPFFSREAAFIIFAVSDAISLFTSTTSMLMFLSILTSRYAEEDFLYALPKRLSIGLVTLFVSISFMMAAFSATLYLVFGRLHAWILIPVAALASLPITSFVLLQFPLLVDVIYNTYGRGIFGKQSNRPFY